jgi:hypothetical protein
VQTENVMLMFHENQIPQRIINTTTTTFTVDDIPFLNVPQYDYDDALSPTPTSYVTTLTLTHFTDVGDRFQIDVEGVLSKNITFTLASASSPAANIQRNLQEMPIFGDTGVAVTGVARLRLLLLCLANLLSLLSCGRVLQHSDRGGTQTIL